MPTIAATMAILCTPRPVCSSLNPSPRASVASPCECPEDDPESQLTIGPPQDLRRLPNHCKNTPALEYAGSESRILAGLCDEEPLRLAHAAR